MERVLARLWNALVTTGLIARQSAVSLRTNWGLGILSVVLAVSFWVYVTDRENPERTGRVPGAVPVECLNEPTALAVFPPCNQSVSVRAHAAESVLERLTADDFRATVDLSTVDPSAAITQRATVTVQVESQESRAEVVDFSPTEITVTLEPVASKTVQVRAQDVGGLARGFRLGTIEVNVAEAAVTGPERLVSEIAVVQAEVDLTGANASFEQRVSLEARGEAGERIQGVTVVPESVVVTVEVIQTEFRAAVIVVPEVSGEPADGYNVTGIEVDPPFVTVSGPPDAFRSIDLLEGIMTETVRIGDATDLVVRTVALRLPQGASVEPTGVTVRISISPAEGTFSFSVAPRLANVGSGLTPTVEQPTVRVVLSGTVPDLSAVGVADIVVTLDLDGLEAGEHVVPLRVQAPPGTAVHPDTQDEVTVRLR